MAFEVRLSQTAERELRGFDAGIQRRLREAMRVLQEDPFRKRPQADIKKLHGAWAGFYRLRLGQYRVFYAVHLEGVVVVTGVRHRTNATSQIWPRRPHASY